MASLKNLNWKSDEEIVLLNPQMPAKLRELVKRAQKPHLKGHLWVASSGTTGADSIKLYALSFNSFLASARAVNAHLEAVKEDTWLNPLPHFHVGGIAIFARAYLTGSHVVDIADRKWEAEFFLDRVHAESVTLTSLVPAQLYDLVALNTMCPPSLRAIIVGGGRLDAELYRCARQLRYPVLPSYGMTEFCSQIATAELRSLTEVAEPKLKILPHVTVEVTGDGKIALRGESMFTLCLRIHADGGVEEIKPEGFYRGEDFIEIHNGYLRVLGRADDQIKILGELVSLADLRAELSRVCSSVNKSMRATVIAEPDDRAGNQIAGVFELDDFEESARWVDEYNKHVLPVAKINKAYYLKQLPATELGKIKFGELQKLIFG